MKRTLHQADASPVIVESDTTKAVLRIKKMYKILVLLVITGVVLSQAYPRPLYARVKGACKNCHSMHYSKRGTSEGQTYGGRSGPFPILTKGGCLGCHGQNPNGTENIIVIGKSRIPQVIHHMENGDLAGGNFYYVADGYNPDYEKGHNVRDISVPEPPPKDIPWGFIENIIIPGGIGPADWTQQLTCAGKWGCHGNRTIEDPFESIHGAHHADDSVIDGTTVGKSYRFLYGIKGKEHKDWEYLATIDNHNGYKGDPQYNATDTISYLCGQCHVTYHLHPNLGGAFGAERVGCHPADIAFMDVRGGYAGSEYQDYINYRLEAPVAYINPTGREREVRADSIVMCLSCHRPHASDYPQGLRWDYDTMELRGGGPDSGCFACHTEKND